MDPPGTHPDRHEFVHTAECTKVWKGLVDCLDESVGSLFHSLTRYIILFMFYNNYVIYIVFNFFSHTIPELVSEELS